MKYLCLIYGDGNWQAKMPPDEKQQIYNEYSALMDDIKQSGHYLGSNPLQSTDTAKTVRVRNGKVSTTDGPFAETKEQLGGYFLIEAKDVDEAVSIAARIPSARVGSIEVRPVLEMRAP